MQTINKIISAKEKKTEVLTAQSGNIDVVVYENAFYELYLLQNGQDLNIKIHLLGKNAKCDLKAVYLSTTNSNNTLKFDVEHATQETYSQQTIKGVVSGYGKGVFEGIIRMPHGSQKCEGNQSHKALLLSENASVECVPELEIYADDVKCSHGSTVGNLDKQQLFYLNSRGIEEKTAKKMLIKAFLFSEMPDVFEGKIDEWMLLNE